MEFDFLNGWGFIILWLIWPKIYNYLIIKFKRFNHLKKHTYSVAYISILILALTYQGFYLWNVFKPEKTIIVEGFNFAFSGGGAGDYLSRYEDYTMPTSSRIPGASFIFPKFDTKIKIIQIKPVLIYYINNTDYNVYTSLFLMKDGKIEEAFPLVNISEHKISNVYGSGGGGLKRFYFSGMIWNCSITLKKGYDMKYYIINRGGKEITIHPDSYFVIHYQKYNEIPTLEELIITNFEIPFLFSIILYVEKFFTDDKKLDKQT